MEGANRVYGVGGAVFFDGRECIVRPRTEEFYGLVDAEILKRRGDPLERVLEASDRLTEDGKLKGEALGIIANSVFAAGRAYRNVSRQEHNEFMDSWDGLALEFWYCLRESHPKEWSIARVRWVLQESNSLAANQGIVDQWFQWVLDIRRSIDMAGGEDLLGNLTGFRLTTTQPGQPFAPSSEPSAKSTDTPPELSAA